MILLPSVIVCIVLHPKISEVWSVFFRQLPNVSDSCRYFPTATDFFRQKMTVIFDIFLRSYLRTAAPCLGTFPPLSPTPNPVPPRPEPAPPSGPADPVENRFPPPGACGLQEITEFYRQNHRIVPTELPIFTDRHRNYPTELPNFTDRH